MFRLPECFDLFTVSSGNNCRWNGAIRSGNADLNAEKIISLCSQIRNGHADRLFKASAKISAGTIDGYFVKMYKLPGFSAQLRRRLRMGRAMHSLLAAEAVTHAHVATPQVLAAVTLISGFHICDFLITDALSEEQTTFNFTLPQRTESEQCHSLLHNILPAVARLHQHGIAHGDLNLRNLFRTDADPGAGVIDLDGTLWQKKPLSTALREQELARLLSGFCKLCGNISCTDIIEAALDNYEQLCMVHCRKEHILRRAEYLLNRTR